MTSSSHIPIVDFAKWTTDESIRQQIAHDLVSACKTVGFVYIINHSLPHSLLDEAFSWSRLFFDLPQEDKLKAPHPEGWAVHRGYSWPGLEKVSQAMSATNDQERIQNLREIPDLKVSGFSIVLEAIVIWSHTLVPTFNYLLTAIRKATILAAIIIPRNPTSGYQKRYSRASMNS